MTDQEESWAFVKNPTCNTETAWEKCFLRTPRCLEWNRDRYRELGLTEQQIDRIPDIRREALMKYAIGWERMPQREKKPSLAMWVDTKPAPQEFFSAAEAYGDSLLLTPSLAEVSLKPTHMDLFDHLALKMILNALSTGVMARMGRITGNWMTSLAMSNKKLMDRSARIVSDVCSVPYELALEEIFYSRALVEADGLRRSPAEDAISRLSAGQSPEL
jgi:N-acetylmuramic acid 6-phosphate etherase